MNCECRGPCAASLSVNGRTCQRIVEERAFTDSIINAIGDISVAEAQQAIKKWREEH